MTREQRLRYICLIVTAGIMIQMALLTVCLGLIFGFSYWPVTYDIESANPIFIIFGHIIIQLTLILLSAFSKKFYHAFAIIQFTFIFASIMIMFGSNYYSSSDGLKADVVISSLALIPYIVYLLTAIIKNLYAQKNSEILTKGIFTESEKRKVGKKMTKEQKLRYICLIITASIFIPITLLYAYLAFIFGLTNWPLTYDIYSTKSILFYFGYIIIVSLLIVFSLASKKAYTGFAIIQSTFIIACLFQIYKINSIDYSEDPSFLYAPAFISFIILIPFIVHFIITKIKKL